MKLLAPLLLLITLCLSSCSKEATPEEQAAIKALIERNVKAYDLHNQDEVLATTAGNAQGTLADFVMRSGTEYRLKVKNIKITKFSGNKATTEVSVLKTSTSDRDDKHVEKSIRTLVKKDGKWKINSRETLSE